MSYRLELGNTTPKPKKPIHESIWPPENLSESFQGQIYFYYDTEMLFALFTMFNDGAIMMCKTASTLTQIKAVALSYISDHNILHCHALAIKKTKKVVLLKKVLDETERNNLFC